MIGCTHTSEIYDLSNYRYAYPCLQFILCLVSARRVGHALYSDMSKFALLQLLRPDPMMTPQTCTALQHNYTADSFSKYKVSGLARLPPSCAARDAAAGRPPAPDTPPKPSMIIGDWKYEAERPQAAVGWIGRYGPAGSAEPLSISFPVVFSAKPRLEIRVLRSYENFLNASLRLSGCAELDSTAQLGDVAPPGLLGSWEKRISIPDVTAWDSVYFTRERYAPFLGVHEMTCIPEPGIVHTLTITVQPPVGRLLRPSDKIKIISVNSC